ncbi:MAG: hypothetical protein ACI9L9_002326, partial [Marivirga sp.]
LRPSSISEIFSFKGTSFNFMAKNYLFCVILLYDRLIKEQTIN